MPPSGTHLPGHLLTRIGIFNPACFSVVFLPFRQKFMARVAVPVNLAKLCLSWVTYPKTTTDDPNTGF
jgi:hypothetical protein